MGDMKTPDFDDLLAAFDIPDIDAKEAIQSAPEEAEGHHIGAGGVAGKSSGNGAGVGGNGSSLLRPAGSPDHHHHSQALAHSSQGDPSVVSVIVKNRVRPDTFGETEVDVDKDDMAGSGEVVGGVGGGVVMGPRIPGLISEPLVHNGFEASTASMDATLSQAQGQSNGDLWAPCSPKIASEGGGSGMGVGTANTTKQSGNIFNRLKPLIAQSPGDPIGKVRKMLLLQQQQQLQVQQQEPVSEGTFRSKASAPCEAGSSLVPGVSVGMSSSFFAPTIPMHSSSSIPSSSHTVGSHLSHSALNEGMPNPSGALSPTPLPTSQPFNGSQQGGFPHLELEDEDSEPDLGSPLVIQESPDSPACTPPKFSRRHRSPPQIFNTTPAPPSSSTSTYIKAEETAQSPSPSLQTTASQSWDPTPPASSLNSTHEEIKSEHVIEERDSPESPEPEMPYSAFSSSSVSAAPGRSSSAAMGSIPLGKEEMDGGKEREAVDTKASGTRHVKAEAVEGERSEDEKMDVEDEEKFDTGDADREKPPSQIMTAGAVTSAVTPGTPSRPLKVRIKTIKTSTGGITRTVTRVAPKGAGSATAKGSDSKGQSGVRKVANKPKKVSVSSSGREASSQQQGAKGSLMPVSTLQDASTAMLLAASKAQNKMAAASDKTKVSATAVSITRTAALPAISSSSNAASSPKFGMSTGGISVRPVGQKVVNGGTATTQISKPASIVNSTGAVISRSQSSLVEAFNKILNSKNLLPSYRPDLSTPLPPEWSLPLPANGYRCLECGDAFALERSLARHYDRRSLRIEVTCNHCAKRLVFFNKCSLLLHAREHKERGLVMQCSHLVMRPVSIEQMIGQQDTTPIGMLSPSLSSSSLTSPSTASVATVSAPAAPSSVKEEMAAQPSPIRRTSDSSQVLLPLPCKKGEELQYNDFKCPECHIQFGSKAELVAHFQEVKAASNTSCMLCSPAMMLPNACSASAHQRIHKHRSPYVCPECGGIARQTSFQTHLEEACLHFARRIGYRCSSCQVVFGGLNSIKSHIQTAHCEVFHKCPSCPMAFKSGPMAQAHITTQHPTLGPAQAKMIYKCVMCDTVFTQKPLLYVHFDTHLAKQKVHVFKCPDCTKLYAQKGSMMEHIKTAHRGLSAKQEAPTTASTLVTSAPPTSVASSKPKSSIKTESSDGEDWAGEQEDEQEEEEQEADQEHADNQASAPEAALTSVSGAAPSEWSCRQCETRYSEREAYISHMRKEHGKSMKKFPCRMCERSFCSAPSLRRHVRVNHEGIRRVFHCQYCTEGKRTFSSRLILEKHIRVQHGIRTRDQEARLSPAQTRRRAELGQTRSDGPDNSSEQDGCRSTLGTGSGEEEGEGAAGSGGEELPDGGSPVKRARGAGPVPEDTTFRCVPCGFSTEDKQEFLLHIPQHRTDGGSLQCSQCGACFTSINSLSRHRFITHRVRDAPDPTGSTTQARSPAGADLASASSSPGSPTTSQQGQDAEGRVGCRVCGRRFDKASDLNTHFRTHGMAFITAHKTDKPA